jgi:hypothetical protein
MTLTHMPLLFGMPRSTVSFEEEEEEEVEHG